LGGAHSYRPLSLRCFDLPAQLALLRLAR
jgi:hypothetical protein